MYAFSDIMTLRYETYERCDELLRKHKLAVIKEAILQVRINRKEKLEEQEAFINKFLVPSGTLIGYYDSDLDAFDEEPEEDDRDDFEKLLDDTIASVLGPNYRDNKIIR